MFPCGVKNMETVLSFCCKNVSAKIYTGLSLQNKINLKMNTNYNKIHIPEIYLTMMVHIVLPYLLYAT